MYKPKKISDFTNKIVDPIIQKKSYVFSKVFLLWEEITHESLTFCEPLKITNKKNNRGLSNLHVQLNSAYAPQFNYKSIRIIEKINSYFGYKVIDKIILHHNDNFNHFKKPVTKKIINSFKSTEKNDVNLSKIDNPNLTKSLKALEKSIFSS